MVHLVGPRGSQGGIGASIGIAVVVSLLVATTVEAGHSHTESDLSTVCSVCKLGHQGAPTPPVYAPIIVEPVALRLPALPESGLIPGVVHLSPHRSRAPPPPISPWQ